MPVYHLAQLTINKAVFYLDRTIYQTTQPCALTFGGNEEPLSPVHFCRLPPVTTPKLRSHSHESLEAGAAVLHAGKQPEIPRLHRLH